MLRRQSFVGLLRAYAYASMISSGPWVLSILVIMGLGYISVILGNGLEANTAVTQFLVSVTYLVAATLILSGMAQLIYTRFVADRLFENRSDLVLPNLFGLLALVSVIATALGIGVLVIWFHATPMLYRLEMLFGFVILANVWCVTVLISGMKAYGQLLSAFAIGFGTIFVLGVVLRGYGLVGLLGGFVIGQAVLLYIVLFLITRYHPADKPVAFDFLRRNQTHWGLLFIGLVYNAAIWADKLVFWFNPSTSISIIGPLRASPIYDLPIFLAYLSILPGMAIFFIRIEVDFAQCSENYNEAIRAGETLDTIEVKRVEMTAAVRRCIIDILKIQGITVVILLLLGPTIINFFGFSAAYLSLFNIDIVAVGFQIVFMAVLNVFFYLDKIGKASTLCLLFLVSNFGLTLLSQWLGPSFYGYGFALSLFVSCLVAMALLHYDFKFLTYRTFMLQASA